MMTPTILADLNQFFVFHIDRKHEQTLITGRLSKPGQPYPGQHVSLYVSLDADVAARVTEVDPDAGTAALALWEEHLHPVVVPGASFPMYDNYWSYRVRLVLDKGLTWAHKQFASPDAFEQLSAQGGRMWRRAEPGDELRTDGKIIPCGWDHEHCELCWTHIDPSNPHGYESANGDWVCARCYERFVEPGDLRFLSGIDDEQLQSIEGQSFETLDRLIGAYNLVGIRKYIDDGGDPNVTNRHGWTPLMVAASRGQ
jgi:hypothetical protein